MTERLVKVAGKKLFLGDHRKTNLVRAFAVGILLKKTCKQMILLKYQIPTSLENKISLELVVGKEIQFLFCINANFFSFFSENQ